MKRESSVILQRLAEQVFVVLALLFYSEALTAHLPVEHPIYQMVPIFNLVIQAVTILLLITRRKRVVRIIIREKLLWVLMIIVLASVFYSDVPMWALYHTDNEIAGGQAKGFLPLIQMTLFGVYFGTRYGLKKQLQLVTWMFGIVALLSIVLGLALPQYGVMGAAKLLSDSDKAHVGAWQGVYIHKNHLGSNMNLSALVFLLLTPISQKHRWVKWAGFSISVGLIVLSTAKSALIIFLTMMALLALYRALRWNYSLAVPFFITVLLVAGGVATLFLGNAETILGAFGRDTTLTGRTDFWPVIVDKIWNHPWLGYGYHVFWRGWEGESADIWRIIQVTHAHNGFLDVCLDIGLLGFCVFALSFITGCLRAVAWVRLTKNAEGLWPLGYLTFVLLSNLTESFIMREDVLWILYVAITLAMHNKAENLAENHTFWQQKVKTGAIKQTTKVLDVNAHQ